MKTFSRGVIFLVLGGFLTITGCATKAEPYNFATGTNTASISFTGKNPSVYFVSFNGESLPKAEKGTHWDPVVFPAGRAVRITVHAFYEHKSKFSIGGNTILAAASTVANTVSTITRSVDKEVVLNCPALRAGEYALSFEKGAGIPGKNTLVLTDLATNTVVYQQEFE